MSLYPELDHLPLPELLDAFHGPPPEGDAYAAAFYDEVTGRIRGHGDPGIRFLVDAVDQTSGDRLASLLIGLAPIQSTIPKIETTLRRCLINDDGRVVMAAVDGLRLLGDAAAMDEVLALRDHPSPYVRGSVLRYMRSRSPKRATPILLEALNDPDPIVRGSAIDELGGIADRGVARLVVPLVDDPDPDVRRAAQLAIEEEARIPSQAVT